MIVSIRKESKGYSSLPRKLLLPDSFSIFLPTSSSPPASLHSYVTTGSTLDVNLNEFCELKAPFGAHVHVNAPAEKQKSGVFAFH